MPCRDSGLPHDSWNILGTSGNVFERLPGREGRTSTLFDDSKNLASSSLQTGPDGTETARKRDSEMNRDSLNTSIPSPHFQSRSGMLNHIGGTYWHNVLMDYPRFQISELHLGKFPADPHLTMHWIKEVEISKSIDEFMTSRSIVGRNDFL